jgi:IS30 family transposase
MPYEVKGKCVYKKDGWAKVGCTDGSVKKYLAALHANADESITPEETITETNLIKGGKADKLTVKDIADKFNVPVSKIEAELRKGKKVEHEHTNNMAKATEIAMDHLSEFPDYYTRLAKMEKEAEQHAKKLEMKLESKQVIKRLLRENLGL